MIETFIAFINAYPDWRLNELGGGSYNLSYRPLPISTNVVITDTPSVIPGPYAPFFLNAVQSAVFDGNILTFRIQGQTYVCGGVSGYIKVKV